MRERFNYFIFHAIVYFDVPLSCGLFIGYWEPYVFAIVVDV